MPFTLPVSSSLHHLTFPLALYQSLSVPLQMHRRQAQNLTPLLAPQLVRHDPVQPAPDRLAALVDQHAGVVVELHDAAVRPRVFLRRPHDHRVPDVAAADFVRGADGYGAAGAGFGAEVALLLDDDDDAVAWWEGG